MIKDKWERGSQCCVHPPQPHIPSIGWREPCTACDRKQIASRRSGEGKRPPPRPPQTKVGVGLPVFGSYPKATLPLTHPGLLRVCVTLIVIYRECTETLG